MILLTGASGFIGRHLTEALRMQFGVDDVIALTSQPTSRVEYFLHHGYREQTLRNLNSALRDVRSVIHLGGWIPYATEDLQSVRMAAESVVSTARLLNCLDFPKLERIVFISSIDVYGASAASESVIPEPITQYARAKWKCEQEVLAFVKRRGLISHILRLGHVYGPGENRSHKLIPETMRRILRGERPLIVGSGRARRSYIYVGDVVESIVRILPREESLGVINVAAPSSESVIDVVSTIRHVTGTNLEIEFAEKHMETHDVVASTERFMSLDVIREFLPLEQGIRREWDWMRKLHANP